jgi:hypothetical protein
LREDFDISGLSRFVLGRFWRIFSPSEQQEFLGLFENLVVLTYSERLLEYADGGGGLRAIGSRPEPDGAIVSSELTRETGSWAGRAPTLQPLRVDWRLIARDGTYKISDVIIDGLSMAAKRADPAGRCGATQWWASPGYSRRNAATDRERFGSLKRDRHSQILSDLVNPIVISLGVIMGGGITASGIILIFLPTHPMRFSYFDK